MQEFNFSHPEFLFLFLLFFLAIFFAKIFAGQNNNKKSSLFADQHLLKHLIINKKLSSVKSMLFWFLIWVLLILAIAAPRIKNQEIEIFEERSALAIIIDLSHSMNLSEGKISKIQRVKYEIEDILNQKEENLEVALIAFAKIPYLITPLTHDKNNIINLLKFLETDLVNMQGSNLNLAIKEAENLLQDYNNDNSMILVMSDGNFSDEKITVNKNSKLSFMGFGSIAGQPMRDQDNKLIWQGKKLLMSKLQKEKMQKMLKNGGKYFDADFNDQDSKEILAEINIKSDKLNKSNKIISWNQLFYIPLIIVLLLLGFHHYRNNY